MQKRIGRHAATAGKRFAPKATTDARQSATEDVHFEVLQDMFDQSELSSGRIICLTHRKQHALTARREGLSKTAVYGADLFHTLLHVSQSLPYIHRSALSNNSLQSLLNCVQIPKGRFCLLFFMLYLIQVFEQKASLFYEVHLLKMHATWPHAYTSEEMLPTAS